MRKVEKETGQNARLSEKNTRELSGDETSFSELMWILSMNKKCANTEGIIILLGRIPLIAIVVLKKI